MKLKMDEIIETYNNTNLLKDYRNPQGVCPKCKGKNKKEIDVL